MLDQKDLDKLTEYADFEGTELGEACGLLLQLYGYSDYVSKVFSKAVETEIKKQLKYFQEHTMFVERVIEPHEPQTIRELVFIDE